MTPDRNTQGDDGLRDLLAEALDTLECVLSIDPDMPTARADYAAADNFLDRARNKLPPSTPQEVLMTDEMRGLIERIEGEVWTGSKRQREALRAKFDGRCAYCGGMIDKMHADHMEPVGRIFTDAWSNPLPAAERRLHKPERNVVENMMPACAPCNLHKGGYSLEQWRRYLQRSAEIVRKQTSTFRAGEKFGIITVSEAPIVFYFEQAASLRALSTEGKIEGTTTPNAGERHG